MSPEVAHRDIKPENIMIRDTGDDIIVKLCDFDLSRRMQTPGLSTFVGGTFPFMAPEMYSRSPYDPLPTDIWSMGIVFLEVLCFSGILAKVFSFPRVPQNSPKSKLKEETWRDIELGNSISLSATRYFLCISYDSIKIRIHIYICINNNISLSLSLYIYIYIRFA